MPDRIKTNNVREKTQAGEMITTSDVTIFFIQSQGPDMVWSKNAVFNAKKYNFPLFSAENELAHDNKRVSSYKIMQKSQIRKFPFSGTLKGLLIHW